MARRIVSISLEGTNIGLLTNTHPNLMSGTDVFASGHMLIVGKDNLGNEYVIRGGPSDLPTKGWGPIRVEAGVPIERSADARLGLTPEQRGAVELDLGGRDPHKVWKNMVKTAEQLNAAGIDYDVLGPNSNSTVRAVLEGGGIDIEAITLPNPEGIMLKPFVGKDVEIDIPDPTPAATPAAAEPPSFLDKLADRFPGFEEMVANSGRSYESLELELEASIKNTQLKLGGAGTRWLDHDIGAPVGSSLTFVGEKLLDTSDFFSPFSRSSMLLDSWPGPGPGFFGPAMSFDGGDLFAFGPGPDFFDFV